MTNTANINHRIFLLDDISQARISSSVQILSLNEVIIGLVKNSLDANARQIKVSLNYRRGFCSVEDDGDGIPEHEFRDDGRLAKPFCTSKYGRLGHTYGRFGRFLSTLAGVSLLAIVSGTDAGADTRTLWCSEEGRMSGTMEEPNELHEQKGTRIRVYNLFSKLPVRSKQLSERFSHNGEVQREFDRLSHCVTALIMAAGRPFDIELSHLSTTFRYRYRAPKDTSSDVADLPMPKYMDMALSVLHQAGLTETCQMSAWRQSIIRSDRIKIYAVMSLEPRPHKLVQFVSLNREPVPKELRPELYQLVNALFQHSNFGLSSDSDKMLSRFHQTHAMHALSETPEQHKPVDRWPMFVMRIVHEDDVTESYLHSSMSSGRSRELSSSLERLIETMVKEFLVAHEFAPTKLDQRRLNTIDKDTSEDNPGQQNKKSTFHETDQGFHSWSRIKSSRRNTMSDAFTGLPFRVSKSSELYNQMGSSNANQLPGQANVGTTHNRANGMRIGTIPWRDPQTGNILDIDSRTGMVVTTKPPEDAAHTENSANGTQSHLSLERPKKRRLQHSSLAEVARNAANYTQCTIRGPNRAIRSVARYGEHDENRKVERQNQIMHSETSKDGSNRCLRNAASISAPVEIPRISKDLLKAARCIQQVDKKFLLVLVSTNMSQEQDGLQNHELVLIDQHAADERYNIEALLRSLRDDSPVLLAQPLSFEVAIAEAHAIDDAKSYFAQWNIIYEIRGPKITHSAEEAVKQLQVLALPPAIAERCRTNPKLIIDLIRAEVWSAEGNRLRMRSTTPDRTEAETSTTSTANRSECHRDAVSSMHHMPERLLDLMNSRACRSAVMFNDELSLEQCDAILRRLSSCTLPFQCAHGRPSMIVLSDLNTFPSDLPLAEPNSASSPFSFSSRHGQQNDPQSQHRATSSTSCINGLSSLNSIDYGHEQSFGNAYRAWTSSTVDSKSLAPQHETP